MLFYENADGAMTLRQESDRNPLDNASGCCSELGIETSGRSASTSFALPLGRCVVLSEWK